MDYEAMVKTAYEEITGIEKEAADELEREDISRIRVEPNTKNYQIGNTIYDADGNGRLIERKRPVKSQNVSVKQAYEEIMGFDKEAAGYAEGVATLGQKLDDAGKQRVLSNIADSKAARQSHTYANPKNVFDRAAGGINKATDSIGNAVGGKLGDKLVNFKPTGKQVAIGGGIAAGTLAAGLAAKKLHDKRKEKAEKTAYEGYEDMVKTAYEEIMGFDKEAWSISDDPKLLEKLEGAKKGTKKVVESEGTSGLPALKYDFTKKSKGGFKPTGKQVAIGGGIAAGTLAAGLAAKKLHDKRKEKAEKAAAYYDEAQLAKEAAEADYAEACAYEEAALSILEELGYFED